MTDTATIDETTTALDPGVVLDYANMTEDQLRGPGPDLPPEDQLRAELAEPARNRWGAYPAPVEDLPVPMCRALWRWDRITDMAAAAAARATALRADTDRDLDARRTDLTASLDGNPTTAAADLNRDREALDAAAADLARLADIVGDNARTNLYYLNGSADTAVGLADWLRTLVGRDVARYLDALDRANRQRVDIIDRVRRLQGWWVQAARTSGGSVTARPLPEAVTLLAAQLSAVHLDQVRNVTGVTLDLAQVNAAERQALAPYAVR